MARKSDNYPLVLLGGSLALLLLLHTIWSILFEDWVKNQLEHITGHTVAEIIEKFGSVGFPVLGLVGVLWFLLVYNRDSNSKNTAQDKKTFFKSPYVYCETRSIRWEDGGGSNLFENQFCLVVGNDLGTGEVLKRSQARIFHMGEPVLSCVKETGATEGDIRHGEAALFGIGRIVSTEIFGMLTGPLTLDTSEKRQYEHNIPIGALSFEISGPGKRGFSLGYMPGSPSSEWLLLMIVSADDAIAMQVRVKIDFAKTESPVTCEVVQ